MATDGSATSGVTQNPITAVDIVLEPDATMIQNAQAANAGLLKNFPKGYALGDEHAPHISVIGGYFYTANLDEVFAGASKVLASEKVMSWKLKAFKYYYIPLKEIGLGGILVEPTADLIRLQDELFDIAGADGIRTGHQRRAGRRALSFWGEVEEHHALFGEGIDARSGSPTERTAVVRTEFARAEIVNEENRRRLVSCFALWEGSALGRSSLCFHFFTPRYT